MRKTKLLLLLLSVFLLNTSYSQCPSLVWADEFDGTTLDLNKWQPQIGDGCDIGLCGWGNNELQYYKAENAIVNNGTLKIVVKKERVKAKNYTSARLRTKGLGDFTFGRFEARIKLLQGQGLWPAFWMLSTNEPYGGWPASGEIDIMELLGQNPEKNYGTIHYGQPWPDNSHKGAEFNLYNGSTFANDFHIFAVEWEPGILRWYVDDVLYSTITEADVAPVNWPFKSGNQMHFLLNIAVGGNWPGNPDATTPFPNQMEVDYVRVYDGGFNVSISGTRLVPYMASGKVYTINNTKGNEKFNWSVPSMATIVSGQGTNSITVNFGETSGNVTCDVIADCISKRHSIGVTVEPNYIYDFSLENFDVPANVSLSSATGTLTEVSNPNPSGVNTSAISAKYIRNNLEQYDVIAYSTSAIIDASLYSSRQKKFYMDVQTNAPVGTEVIIQLESADATSTNYPTGRHSRYVGKVTQNGAWERIVFDYLDSPDGSTADTGIATIILLFNSNSFTGDTYYWDNFDSYKADDGSGTSNAAPVASFTYSATNLSVNFNGSGSTDSDGSIISYVWDFGNGITGSGALVSSTYATAGNYTVTLTVIDNEGASASKSQVVSVSDGSSGTPVSMHVQSIVTGTADAGAGKKYGTTTVTIHDNLESTVSGATVTATFSGTFSETVSGVTGTNGTVTLKTTATAKGIVTVYLCVDNVTHSILSYASADNDITCTNTKSAFVSVNDTQMNKNLIYPNPASTTINFTKTVDYIEIVNVSGMRVITIEKPENNVDISNIPVGMYLIRVVENNSSYSEIIIKQ